MKNFFFRLYRGRLLIPLSCLMVGVPLTSYAESTQSQDCTVFTRIPYNGYQYFPSIYPESLYLTAQKNFRNYCCRYESKVTPPEMDAYCQANPTDEYVNSPWFYDHLVDVGFRYLDGLQDLQYEGALVDTKGKERRDKISELGSDPQGAIPLAVLNEYKNFRGDRTQDMDIIQSQTETCQQSTKRFADYNEHRDELPLSKKYFIMCEIDSCLSSNEKNTFLPACQNLALKRIQDEDRFVQGVILIQANQAVHNNFLHYAQGYLTNQRMNSFLEKTVLMTKGFQFVDNKVPELTRSCSG